ncbi:MAG TPA: DNA-3-methyladenine glycosylase [Anaerolineaceae bacterium]|nr:DNA-3-methyladenine glycosylase [Anaerolineaceae bacterium]HPN51035.1 DNA-3-methyladenine glycosylase [Anaerolineaceae bacterium]
MSPLSPSFFERPALAVARDLLGCILFRIDNTECMAGVIVETEAYQGEDDLGCHAHHGRTARTEVMYGPPGRAYVYFTYGMHWMLNAVTGPEGTPAAVLIRAIQPVEGIAAMTARRPRLAGKAGWLNGPAKLTQALAIDGRLNGKDLCSSADGLYMEAGLAIPDERVSTSARIGLFSVPEPWKSIPWRFVAQIEEQNGL